MFKLRPTASLWHARVPPALVGTTTIDTTTANDYYKSVVVFRSLHVSGGYRTVLTQVVCQRVSGDCAVGAFVQGNPRVQVVVHRVALDDGTVARPVEHDAVFPVVVHLSENFDERGKKDAGKAAKEQNNQKNT